MNPHVLFRRAIPAHPRPAMAPRRGIGLCRAGLLSVGLFAPAVAMASCTVDNVDQKTVVTATVILGLSEHCEAPIDAFPAPFTCDTELIGTRSGGSDSLHAYDTGIDDIAQCGTDDDIDYCYANGAPPPSQVAFVCVAEIHRALLDLFPASAQSSCGCASLKRAAP